MGAVLSTMISVSMRTFGTRVVGYGTYHAPAAAYGVAATLQQILSYIPIWRTSTYRRNVIARTSRELCDFAPEKNFFIFWHDTAVMLLLGHRENFVILHLKTFFFSHKVKNYNLNYLKEDFVSEKIIFDFITLFGIIFFAFVILFPFYIMLVTSFKTQIALLVNPLDFSLDFKKDLSDLFKSYFVIFDTYNFGRYILISLSLIHISEPTRPERSGGGGWGV